MWAGLITVDGPEPAVGVESAGLKPQIVHGWNCRLRSTLAALDMYIGMARSPDATPAGADSLVGRGTYSTTLAASAAESAAVLRPARRRRSGQAKELPKDILSQSDSVISSAA